MFGDESNGGGGEGQIRQNLRVRLDGLRDHELTGVDAFFDSLTEALSLDGLVDHVGCCVQCSLTVGKASSKCFLRQKVTLAERQRPRKVLSDETLLSVGMN